MKISDFFKKQDKTNNEPSTSKVSLNKKRKLSDSPKRPNKSLKDNDDLDEFQTTPSKYPKISVKTPDKLLTPEALKALNQPQTRVTTPKRLFRDNLVVSPLIANGKLPTPTKQSPTKSNSKKDSVEKTTPNKTKRTPKKLFERSPKNLNEFNVEVISDFVKITPSKSMNKDNDYIIVSSSEKKQVSILKYLSPNKSGR